MKIHEMFPYLCVSDANAAIDFYVKVFGVTEKFRLTEPSGRIGHAELDFNGMTLMLSDEFPEFGMKGPTTIGAPPVTIHLHVDNADELIRRAAGFGATVEREPKDEFYGGALWLHSGSLRSPVANRPQHRGGRASRNATSLHQDAREELRVNGRTQGHHADDISDSALGARRNGDASSERRLPHRS